MCRPRRLVSADRRRGFDCVSFRAHPAFFAFAGVLRVLRTADGVLCRADRRRQSALVSRSPTRKLSTQIFVAQLAILTATVLIGFVLFAAHRARPAGPAVRAARRVHRADRGRRSGHPGLSAGRAAPCREPIQTIASRIQNETQRVLRRRHRHEPGAPFAPDPALIGTDRSRSRSSPSTARPTSASTTATTGTSANGKAPMYGPDGRMIGEVSVGIKESSVSTALWDELPTYAGWFAVALAAGAAASWLLARRLKRKTFGLELDEIARLLQEREATLHGIREGVIAFDPAGRVSVVNDEAQRLLGGAAIPIGGRLDDLLPPGRLRDVLAGHGDRTGRGRPHRRLLPDRQPDAGRPRRPTARRRRHAARPHRDVRAAARTRRRAQPHRRAACAAARVLQPPARGRRPARTRRDRRGARLPHRAAGGAAEFADSLRAAHRAHR